MGEEEEEEGREILSPGAARGDIIMGERGGGGGKGGGGIMVEATGFGTNHQGGNVAEKEEGLILMIYKGFFTNGSKGSAQMPFIFSFSFFIYLFIGGKCGYA